MDINEKPDQAKVGEFPSLKSFLFRISQFQKLSKTLKHVMYPDVTSLNKMNYSKLVGLIIEEMKIQLISLILFSLN